MNSFLPRRRPGSGLTPNQPTIKLTRRSVPELQLQLKVPSIHWRYLLIALTVVVSLFTFNQTTKVKGLVAQSSANIPSVKAQTDSLVFLPKLSSVTLPPQPVKNPGVKEPYFPADSVLLIDRDTKVRLYEKKVDSHRSVASTTKIVTAQVALESYPDLNQRVAISREAMSQIGSEVGFQPGETATIGQLLYGLLVTSGNDAAWSLAEHLPGLDQASSIDTFTQKMNEYAVRIGMRNSRFYDPAGLNDNGYSTAADMVIGLDALLKKPELVKIIGTANYEYTSNEGHLHNFENSNRLVTDKLYYPGVIGGKTGFTPQTANGGAGHCLLVAAKRDGHELIVSVFGTYSNTPEASAEVAKTVLDYGFNNFTWQKIAR